jgi:hypothetical protein
MVYEQENVMQNFKAVLKTEKYFNLLKVYFLIFSPKDVK